MAAEDLAGIVAPSVRQFELKGRIRVEGKSADGPVPVQIFCEGSDADEYSSLMRRAQPQPDGAFSIGELTADRYTIRVANMEGGGYYLKAVRVNGVPVPGAAIDLSGGPVGDVELILSAAVGSVEGTVRWPDAPDQSNAAPEPPGELTVVIVPQKLQSGDSRTQIAYLDQGSFQVTDLEPGDYRLFAVTGYDRGLWQNAGFLQQISSRGTVVEVVEKQSPRIELQVLRAAEVRQARERVE
jgi:hypothetical protein